MKKILLAVILLALITGCAPKSVVTYDSAIDWDSETICYVTIVDNFVTESRCMDLETAGLVPVK